MCTNHIFYCLLFLCDGQSSAYVQSWRKVTCSLKFAQMNSKTTQNMNSKFRKACPILHRDCCSSRVTIVALVASLINAFLSCFPELASPAHFWVEQQYTFIFSWVFLCCVPWSSLCWLFISFLLTLRLKSTHANSTSSLGSRILAALTLFSFCRRKNYFQALSR